VTLKNVVFWDVTSVRTDVSPSMLVAANVVSTSLSPLTPMMEMKPSFRTRATRRHIPEEGILHKEEIRDLRCFDLR
jgi:hypothetical protein